MTMPAKGQEIPLDKRLWKKIEVGPADKCWCWRAKAQQAGYGVIQWKGKAYKAHRIAWMLTYGELPPSSVLVCHRCDNRLCCNPTHLFLGSPKDNTLDALRKGRLKRGKFSPAQVHMIRAAPRYAIPAMAHHFNVRRQAIWSIRRKAVFKDL